MDRKQARELIDVLFSNPFDRDRYQHFLRNLLNRIEPGSRGGRHYAGNLIPDAFRGHVNQYWCLGKYVDPQENELDLLVVEVKTFSKLERARSALRNFAINRLKQFDKEASLIAFYAVDDHGTDWRFSFVKIEHSAYKDAKGKVKLKEELTPARRHSFLVGKHEKSHTACRQLLPILEMDYADPKIEEIEAAFSIEKVTSEFFDQYKALFVKLVDHLKQQHFFQRATNKKTDQAVSRFAKKLLGQIVFLYFLQKKGWLGVAKDKPWGEGVRDFMWERFERVNQKGNNYFCDFLQYLFYEALADDRKNQEDPGYYKLFDCRVPFLNGGLFEADYKDWKNVAIDIPNSLFHNNEKNKAGDEGTGILDVFGRYNFTIKEDEPLDKEVAVDPEMLGKVFENMLEISERKRKGAFYTPREIVHYMCQESLVNYLHTELNRKRCKSAREQSCLFNSTEQSNQVSREDLETLVRNGHLALDNDTRVIAAGKETKDYKFQLPESIRTRAQEIDTSLAGIKVCDPAIGSGAFPVGLLHEIVNARLALAPHSGNIQKSYDLKRHAIAHSIYGVDTDPSAIDIARLRLWLSLIVDEDNYDDIAALPNLDYKIMQGNSLVEEYWGVKLFNEGFLQEDDRNKTKIDHLKELQSDIQKEFLGLHNTGKLTTEKKQFLEKEAKNIEKKIKSLRTANLKDHRQGLFDVVSEAKRKASQLEQFHKDFFSTSSPKRKQEIRQRISKLEWELIEATVEERNQQDLLDKLQEVRQSGEKPFFLWKLNFSEVFKEKGGFDVVIGNPPYVQIQNFSGQQTQQDLESQHYDTFAKTGDIYCLFYEKGHRLLRDNGALCFITSNKWMRAAYGEKLRRFFSEKTQPITLIDFSSFQVFETATVDTNVLIFNKAKCHHGVQACLIDPSFTRTTPLSGFVAQKGVEMVDLSGGTWAISSKAGYKIKKRIEAVGTPLKDWDIALYRGILTGFNEAFIINGKKKDELIAADPKSAEIIKPILRGRDIKRYRIDFADLWLITTHNGYKKVLPIDVNDYPSIKVHLEKVEQHRASGQLGEKAKKAKGLYKRDDQGKTPFNLRNCAYIPDFEKEKIVWGNLALSCQFALADKAMYINAPSPLIAGGDRYLLAVLNSTVGDYYIRSLGVTRNGGYFEYKPMFVENLPIPQLNQSKRKPFETLANYILDTAKKDLKLQSAYFEQLIDGLVYELYFPDEIKAAGKEILPHLGELTPITDQMSAEEKLAVIQAEFDRLYDPSHPVRNRLETMDSVEVVRTIREALKR